MDIIENIVRYFTDKEDGQQINAPEGVCPVCWGHQEYDGKIKEIFKDKQIDVNNNKSSYMLIQNFMVNKIDGIKLKEGEVSECPICSSNK